jgi:hypothetical protein
MFVNLIEIIFLNKIFLKIYYNNIFLKIILILMKNKFSTKVMKNRLYRNPKTPRYSMAYIV